MNKLLNRITPVLDWVRTNPLMAICAAVIVAALVSFYYPTHVQSVAFEQEAASRQSVSTKIDSYFRTQADLPPAQPDDPPRRISMVITDAAIDNLKSIYQALDQEHKQIFQYAVDYNREGHQVLVDGLFPVPLEPNQMPFDARDNYLKAFVALYSYLDATTPAAPEAVQAMLTKDEETYKRELLLGSTGTLSDQQKQDLLRRQTEKVMRMYRSNAEQHHLYADPVVLDPTKGRTNWKPGPFEVDAWAGGRMRPNQLELWDGQMELWIQQDIVVAIAHANHTDDPNASIVNSPVKRLLDIHVSPEYIGLHATTPGTPVAAPPPGSPPGAIAALDDNAVKTMLEKRLPDNFTQSPTGRVTNPLYDVRHATVSMIVDSKRINEVLNAFGKVNFMTVIGVNTRDVDEFDALRQGYWYGKCDAVQLDLQIESIWLRQWTAGSLSAADAKARGEKENHGLMPDIVRVRLGLKPWDAEELAREAKAVQASGAAGTSSIGPGTHFTPGPGGFRPGGFQ